MNILRIENISKSFNKQVVLKQINMELERGKVYGLLGENGVGKTTLIKIINDLVVPDEGEVFIDNISLSKNRHTALGKIGTLFDGSRNLYYGLTPLQNALYFGQLKGRNKTDIKNTFEKYIDLLEMKEFYNKKVGNLSLGQKQRASISVVLSYDPEILIFDEPTNGLDLFSVDQLKVLFNDIKSKKEKSILISSHNIEFISNISDNIFILHNSEIKKYITNQSYGENIEVYRDVIGRNKQREVI